MKQFWRSMIPWLVAGLFVVEMVAVLMPKADKDFQYQQFGRLPVMFNGRIQPFDSLGRNILFQIRGTTSVPLEEKKSYEFWKHPKKLKPTEWLMEVLMRPEQADERPAFLVHHPDILNELKLRGKGVEKSGLFYFSYNELSPALETIDKEGQAASAIESRSRSAYQEQMARLYESLLLYQQARSMFRPAECTNYIQELEQFKQTFPAGRTAVMARRDKKPFDQAVLDAFVARLSEYEQMSGVPQAQIVPSLGATNEWLAVREVMLNSALLDVPMPRSFLALAGISDAWRNNDVAAFNRLLQDYSQQVESVLPKESAKSRLEFFYNRVQFFLHATIIYVAGFLFGCFFWLNGAGYLRRSAIWLVLVAFLVHSAGMIIRMMIEGRPPVTNLYSSAVFVGWGAVMLGLFLERFFKDGMGCVTAAAVGFITQIIALNMALGNNGIEVLRAVLDTNFWLATHVLTITLGYSSNFVAGFLATLYILRGVFTRGLTPDSDRAMQRMVYGIICFATLFSFIGTITGGIWADKSWGRFWGWDPKENGALIVVLWNALILHVICGRMVRGRGLMNLALLGNVVTAFSWFGVNMLGVGLHSYGFTTSTSLWLGAYVVSQLILLALGVLPLALWRSKVQT